MSPRSPARFVISRGFCFFVSKQPLHPIRPSVQMLRHALAYEGMGLSVVQVNGKRWQWQPGQSGNPRGRPKRKYLTDEPLIGLSRSNLRSSLGSRLRWSAGLTHRPTSEMAGIQCLIGNQSRIGSMSPAQLAGSEMAWMGSGSCCVSRLCARGCRLRKG